MAHNVEIHNIERDKQTGGITFILKCCGELEHRVHLVDLAAYDSDDERTRVISDLVKEHAERHERELATEQFLRNFDVTGCQNCK